MFTIFRLLSVADAIVFDVRYAATTVLPSHQNPDQFFVLTSYESPVHKRTDYGLSILPRDYFNLTMTYRSNSDIDYAFGHFDPITENTDASEIWQWHEVTIGVIP